MTIEKKQNIFPVLLALAFAGTAVAAVPADEAKQLGGATLTAVGAEKAGNKEGTIPPYTGEGLKAPANFGADPKDPYSRPDPFANEKPLFTITAQNAAKYADKLDGLIEMFKVYPNFRMDIYPSHRTVVYPKNVVDNTMKNATSCKGLDKDEIALGGCWGGVPFPIPKSGQQVMWNHLTSYRGQAWEGFTNSYIVAPNGSTNLVGGIRLWQQSEYYDPKQTAPSNGKTVYFAGRYDTVAPARRVGDKLVLLDVLDMVNTGPRAYQYLPGQRRVKLAPDLRYDTPSPAGGGTVTMDDNQVFSGPLDRYDWKLVGKKEKFVMYNSFKLADHSSSGCNDAKLLTKNFANPECVRWELHRVWVVEAKLKPGFRHIYPRRVFFWDEDCYGVGLAENYDASNKLFRVVTSLHIPFFTNEPSAGGSLSDNTLSYDFQTGGWAAQGILGEKGAGYTQSNPHGLRFFSPDILAGEGVR